MSSDRTPEDILKENIEALGKDLGETFTFLHNDFLNLLLEWDTYKAFFGTNLERVNLLNSISGLTAFQIEKRLFHSVLLGLRRLSEKMKGAPEESPISIDKLLYFAPEGEGKKELRELAKAVRKECAFAKNWSDKKIAHSDWAVRTGRATLEVASRQKTENALRSIAEFIQKFGKLFLGCIYVFDVIKPLDGDEVSFLEALLEGHKAIEDRKTRGLTALKERNYDDPSLSYEPPDWLKREDQVDWRFKDFDV